jgi:hypothetical protein
MCSLLLVMGMPELWQPLVAVELHMHLQMMSMSELATTAAII